MAGEGMESEARLRAFSSNARVQMLLHSILKVETHEYGTQSSFVELLKPSPTMDEAMAAIGSFSDGEGEGGTLKAVIDKLDVVLRGLDRTSILDGSLEARLKAFEEEDEMPEEGLGGLFRLLKEPGVIADACVMFLSTYFDAAAAPEGSVAGGNKHFED